MPPRKRSRRSEEHAGINGLEFEPRQNSLASRLRKKILSSSCEDYVLLKTEKTKNITANAKTGSKKTPVADVADSGLICNFKARQNPPSMCFSRTRQRLHCSHSFVHYLFNVNLGTASSVNKQSVLKPVVRELEDLSLFRTASPFNRRVTALEWHPTKPSLVVAGSKGGEIILWNSLNQNLDDHFVQGIGPGGSIQAIKFWPWNTDLVLTASIDGRVTLNDFEGKNNQVLSETRNSYEVWYCSVDVSASWKAVAAGDNNGNTHLLTAMGKKLWSHRLHKQKVTHTEFSPREDWLLVTSSTDQTVKVWDIRKVANKDSALCTLKHEKPINSAYFSHTDGCRLLTTDQCNQIRIYQSPDWHLERIIEHPHRFFQHLTPIKASWHPLQDLVVVGRYPSASFPGYVEGECRTIDIFDANTGKIVYQLYDPAESGIVSLNKFNARGDYLVSGMGVNLLLWGRRQEVEVRRQSLLTSAFGLDSARVNTSLGSDRQSGSRKRRPPSAQQTKTKQDSNHLKLKVQTKTEKSKKEK